MDPRMWWGNQPPEGSQGNTIGYLVGLVLIIAAALVFIFATPALARAQNQAAAVRIAENGDPTLLVPNYQQCFVVLSRTMKPKDASKECLKAIKAGGEIVKKVNNESADATKNNWPAISPYGGYGYGYGYNGGLSGAYAPGFIPGGGPGGLNIVSTTGMGCGEGGCNRRY